MLSKQLREELRNKGKGISSNCLRHFNPHSRALVDHHDAIGITQVHDLLSVGVVAGAERVCPQPAQQVEVLHNQGPVKAFAADLRRGRREKSQPVTPLGRGFSSHVTSASLLAPRAFPALGTISS